MKSLMKGVYVLCLLGMIVGRSLVPLESRALLLIPLALGTGAACAIDRLGAMDSGSCLMLLGLAGVCVTDHIVLAGILMVAAALAFIFFIRAHRSGAPVSPKAGLALLSLDAIAGVVSAII